MRRDRVIKSSARKIIGRWIFGATVSQRIARIYVFIILAGFGALNLPWVKTTNGQANGQDTWFSKLFTSVSAFTTTGLLSGSSLDSSFNFAGQLIILVLIQIGGLGIVTIWIILKQTFLKHRKYSIEDRINIHSERGGVSEGSSYVVIRSALISLLWFELFVASSLTFFFYFVDTNSSETLSKLKGNFWNSFWSGIFHSISAINNAGLDILDKNSISSFSRGWGVVLSVVFAACSMVGGIGYSALYEIKEWLLKKRNKEKTKNILTLFTKISILMYLAITLLAGGGVVLTELFAGNNHCMPTCTCKCESLKASEKIWQWVYLVISSRSAGFYGINPTCLHEKSQWILLMLMFIGASPASTAGGIRSITLFLMLGKIWTTIRGRRTLSIFSRSVSDQTIDSAYIVFFVSSALITLCSLGIPNSNENNKNGMRHASLFEAASAFGTAGLSLGVSSKTTWVGHVLLMFLMFIGQLGVPNSLVYYNKPRATKQNFSYPEEKLRIA